MATSKLLLYAQLMRWHRPIGIYLVLWPTLWALWLAAEGPPRWDVLVIFILGAAVMRSAGCVINDIADRKVDGHVRRTRERPLASGALHPAEALALFVVLIVIALGLVLLTNALTLKLALGAVILAALYPFMKRYTHLPQVVLGAAFAWAVPMAFAAQNDAVPTAAGLVYVTVVLWTVCYDTFYAMADREDDLKIGVKSTAILFGDADRAITGLLQLMTLGALLMMKARFGLGDVYVASLMVVAALFAYQQYLVRRRQPEACLRAFLNNNWVGMAVFVGIAGDYALRTLASNN